MADDITRVLFLTPAIDGADGISALSRQVVASLARARGSANVEVWALDGGVPRTLAESGVETWSAAGSRIALVRRTMARAARRADDLHVVVLHVHLAPLASLLGRRGAATTLFLIGIEVWTALRPRERRAVERADRLVAISHFTARGFREANPTFASRAIAICSPGVGSLSEPSEPGVINTSSPPRRTRRTRRFDRTDPSSVTGASAASSVVGYGFALIVGRLSAAERYKGHEALIDAWPAIRAAVADARLVVAGDGDDRARLQRMVADRGLGSAIAFLGRVDDEVLAELYRRAAFFVMPSPREGFGLVYLEAMRAGKPCIAAHGSADEIIRHGVDGFVVNAGSIEALTTAVVRLFRDETERARMGAAARARVLECFSEAQFDRRLLEALAVRALPEATVMWARR